MISNTRTEFVFRLSDNCFFKAFLFRGEGWKGYVNKHRVIDGVDHVFALHRLELFADNKKNALQFVRDHASELIDEANELESKQN